MKKFSWIMALLLALSLAFIGCPEGDEKDPPPPPEDVAATAAIVYLNNGASYDDGTGIYTLSAGSPYKELVVAFNGSIEGLEVVVSFTSSGPNANITPTNTTLDFTTDTTNYGNDGCDPAMYERASGIPFTPTLFANSIKISGGGSTGDFSFSELVITLDGEEIQLVENGEDYPNLTIPREGVTISGDGGAEDIVLTAFTDADKAGGYDSAYAEGEWTFAGNTGQVTFAIGEKIDAATYSKVIIEGSTTGTTGIFTVKLIDSENTELEYGNPIPSQVIYNNVFTSGKVEIPITLANTGGTELADLIGFENVWVNGGPGSDVGLTITKVTFEAAEAE